MSRKLENLAQKHGKTESEILRQIIDAYLDKSAKKKICYEPLKKTPTIGLKVCPRTITKEQDKKLRKIAEKTGRTISELVREAVDIS